MSNDARQDSRFVLQHQKLVLIVGTMTRVKGQIGLIHAQLKMIWLKHSIKVLTSCAADLVLHFMCSTCCAAHHEHVVQQRKR
jgi:hypothetical protein